MHWSEIAALFSVGGVIIVVITWFANVFWEKKWGQKSQDLILFQTSNNDELKRLFDKLNNTLTRLNVSFDYLKGDVKENSEKIKEHDDKIHRLETEVERHKKYIYKEDD